MAGDIGVMEGVCMWGWVTGDNVRELRHRQICPPMFAPFQVTIPLFVSENYKGGINVD